MIYLYKPESAGEACCAHKMILKPRHARHDAFHIDNVMLVRVTNRAAGGFSRIEKGNRLRLENGTDGTGIWPQVAENKNKSGSYRNI